MGQVSFTTPLGKIKNPSLRDNKRFSESCIAKLMSKWVSRLRPPSLFNVSLEDWLLCLFQIWPFGNLSGTFYFWPYYFSITLPTKVRLVKAMVFPVVLYGCESWTIKKAERQRIGAFELWCWRRLLRAPSTARRSNQSILKEISPEYSLEGLILKLKLLHFGHFMRRANSFEKTLMLGKIEGRRRGWQRMRWLDGITDSMDISLRKL